MLYINAIINNINNINSFTIKLYYNINNITMNVCYNLYIVVSLLLRLLLSTTNCKNLFTPDVYNRDTGHDNLNLKILASFIETRSQYKNITEMLIIF